MLRSDPSHPAPFPPRAGGGRVAARLHGKVVPSDMASRLAPAIRWPGALDVEDRSWRLVARTPDFDAWLIAWPTGGKVELHDHGASSGAVSVISGTLVEAVPWRDDTGRLSLVRHELRAGTTLGFGAGHVHDVTNEAGEHALSLHVYSPALTSMTFFDLVGNRLEAQGLRWAYDGSEERDAALDLTSWAGARAAAP
ncbi:MAG: cysteine dioxygenase family protein [Acidimicrobiales bacterium]